MLTLQAPTQVWEDSNHWYSMYDDDTSAAVCLKLMVGKTYIAHDIPLHVGAAGLEPGATAPAIDLTETQSAKLANTVATGAPTDATANESTSRPVKKQKRKADAACIRRRSGNKKVVVLSPSKSG